MKDLRTRFINKMKVSGAYVDELFLCVMDCVLQSDIILIHMNKHTATNAVYMWLKGGEFLSETARPKCPLFFGNDILLFDFYNIQGVPKKTVILV